MQVDLAVQAPSLTELVTLPKPTQVQLDTSQVSTELVIGPKKEKTSLDKTFVVILKHTVQIMPGITKWIDVQVQEQPSIIDSRTDATPCSTTDTKEYPEQCTEHSIGQHPCSDQSGQTWTNPELHSIPVGGPFACIGMDFKEMDENYDKNRFALVFQDYLSKWLEVYAVAD